MALYVLPDLLSSQKEQAEQRAADEDFRLPINQRIVDSLDDEGLQMASMHEFIPESNKGFQMLQRMGWKGQGLGSKEDGTFLPHTGFQKIRHSMVGFTWAVLQALLSLLVVDKRVVVWGWGNKKKTTSTLHQITSSANGLKQKSRRTKTRPAQPCER